MYRQANCLSETSRKTLSMALIQCHFDYHCSSWYEGVCKSLRNKLQVMQNKTVRFVKKLGPRNIINYTVFSEVGILNIENRVQQLRLNHVHNNFYDKDPKYMGQNFSKARDLHHHSIRDKQYNFVVPNANGMTSTTFILMLLRTGTPFQFHLKVLKISSRSNRM